MNRDNQSSTRMNHLTSAPELSSRLIDDKSCNTYNTNKRIKLHQERRFGASNRMDSLTSSSSSDDDESKDNLSPFNLSKPVKRNANKSNSRRAGDEKQPQYKSSINKVDSANEYRKTLPVNEDNDSSSSSNCSCERLSDDQQDDERLDYDDDSITNSPPGSSSRRNNTPLPITSPSETANASENKKTTSNTKINDKHERQLQTSTLKSDESPSSHSVRRLKSVINLNHKTSTQDKKSPNPEGSSPKSYHSLLRYLFKDACFFQMKSINHENINISKSMGIWSTPMANEIRLNSAFREHRNVILVFSVQQSGGFQGFARMVSESEAATRPLPWILPERLSSKALRGVFNIQWICKKELPFHQTQDLYNSYNDNKPIKVARDGQQVESRIGKKLCKLFPEDDRDRLLDSVSLMKHQTSQRKKYPNRYDSDSYPFAYRLDLDTRRRDAIPADNPFHHHHHHHHHPSDELRRLNDHPNLNYRGFDAHNLPGFHGVRQQHGPYHQHNYHPSQNPPPYQIPINQYQHPLVWPRKPDMLRNHDDTSRR